MLHTNTEICKNFHNQKPEQQQPKEQLVYSSVPWKIYRQDAGMGEYDYAVFLDDVFYCRTDDEQTATRILNAVSRPHPAPSTAIEDITPEGAAIVQAYKEQARKEERERVLKQILAVVDDIVRLNDYASYIVLVETIKKENNGDLESLRSEAGGSAGQPPAPAADAVQVLDDIISFCKSKRTTSQLEFHVGERCIIDWILFRSKDYVAALRQRREP